MNCQNTATTRTRTTAPWWKAALLGAALAIGGAPSIAQTTLISPTGDGGFENGATFAANGWTVANSANNPWFLGTAVTTSPIANQSAYISNTGGTSNAYGNTAIAVNYLYRDITVPAGEALITMTFNWACTGESIWDMIQLFTAPTSVTPVAAIVYPGSGLSTTNLVGATWINSYNLNASVQTTTTVLPPALAGTTFRLIIGWKNDGSGGTPPAVIDNISLTSAIPVPVCGIKTIDNTLPTAGSNYASFTAAINDINLNGICGPVTFNVAAGQTFNENTPALTATGTAVNTITFQKSGAGVNPVITPTGSAGVNDAGITIAGGDYITFDGIDINASAVATVEYGYLVRNLSATDGAQFNTIQNTAITLNRTLTASRGILQSSTTTGAGFTPTAASGANSNNTYRNLTIRNVYAGIFLSGGSTTLVDQNNAVTTTACGTYNIIGDPTVPADIGGGVSFVASFGIQATNQSGCTISNNRITNISNTTGQLDGINFITFQGTCTASNNIITALRRNSTTSTANVAGIRATHTTTGTHALRINNNSISDLTTTYTGAASAIRAIKGITLASTAGTNTQSYEVWHNSISLNGSASPNLSSVCFETTNAITGPVLTVRNNVFANYTGAQAGIARHYGVAHSNSATQMGNTGSVATNNAVFIPNDAGVSGFTTAAGATPTNYNGAAAWQTAVVQASGNLNDDPLFINATSNLTPQSPLLNAAGFSPAPAYLTIDLACAPRGNDIGAYEFTPPNCIAPQGTAVSVQDCANGQFFINVNVTSLSFGPGVDVVSNFPGDPGADLGVGVGTYQIGPFPSNTPVVVSLLRNGDPTCDVVLGTYTYDCSTFGQNALSFDGVNDGVNLGAGASLNITGTALTLEAWIFPTSFKANAFEGNIINKEGGFAGYQIRCGAAGLLESALGTGAGFITVTSPANTITLNTWQHVAVTYDGTTARLFKNGVQVASVAGTLPIVTSAPNTTRIGDYAVTPGARNFPGRIDEVRIWNVARAPGDIAAFVNQQLCGDEAGLAAYYRFDQGIADGSNPTVTTLIDLGPNGNTGTLGGFALNGTTSNWVQGKTGMGTCVACTGAPTAGTITGTALSCVGANNVLTLTGATIGLGITRQWRYGPVGGPYTNLLGTAGNQSTSGVPLGSYEMVVDVTCNAGPTTVTTAPFAFSVSTVPTASASAGPGCLGQTLNLTGTTDIGTTFAWTGPNTFNSTSQNPSIPTITAAAAGTYSFTATANGCSSAPATVSVSVNASPVISSTTATPGTICPGGTSQLQVNAGNTTGTYCTTSYTSGTGSGDFLTRVTIPTTTLNNITGASAAPFYTLYPASGSTTANLAAGTAYALEAVAGTYSINDVAVWIDYNQDGVFQDPGEKLGQVDNFGAGPVVATINFTVPVGAFNGSTRMRVREADQGVTNGMSACGGLTYGEVEDYVVTITGGASPISYSWNNAGSLSSSTITNPVATPATTTTYTVTVTNGSGCSVQGSAPVTVAIVDDGNVCTLDACLNGVVTNTFQDADGDLTCDANDGCPNDPNKIAPGICGCGVADTDSDNDGTANCNDGCPNDPNKVAPGQCGCGNLETDTDLDGTADCNDLCPLDPLKTNPGLCGCSVPEGTCNDCEGNPAGPAQPGTSCNDNNACTINDVWSPSCVCAGTFEDTDGDGTCNANDGCPTDPNKIAPGICGCGVSDVDTDGDGLADCIDNCPLIVGQIGSACNDNNPNTTGDVIDANCVCAGTVPNCPDNLTVLTLTTDNNAAQTTWEVVPQGGGAAVCSGVGMTNNSSFAYNCCLPSGCYSLRVLDSFGDGMNSGPTGGYVLRDANNARIIDNAGDGIFTFTSQAADVFCVPISADALTAATCDQENVAPSYVIQAQENLAVSGQVGVTNSTSGYQFWIFNPDGGYSRRVTQTLASPGSSFPAGTPLALRPTYLRLNSLTTNPVPPYVLLNVRVRIQTASVFGPFGSACRLKVDPPCGTTQLTTIGVPINPGASCGATGVVINGGLLYADVINGANRYQFEFTRPGYSRLIAVNSRTLTLSNWANKPLLCGLSYTVRVRASFDNGATWCAYGSACTITTESCPAIAGGDHRDLITVDGSDLTVWPNPNRGESLRLSIEDLGATYTTANVDITDLFGKRVMAQTIAVQGNTLNTVLELTDMAAGMYMVNVTVGEKTYMKRLMVQ
jgi:hypothetical protein